MRRRRNDCLNLVPSRFRAFQGNWQANSRLDAYSPRRRSVDGDRQKSNRSWRRARRCKRLTDHYRSKDSFSDRTLDSESEPFERATGMRKPRKLPPTSSAGGYAISSMANDREIEFEIRGTTVYPLFMAASTRVIENPSAGRGFSPSAGIASKRRDSTGRTP